MSIVVDPPAFVPMFKSSDSEYLKFSPVRDWVTKGPGKFVMGGTQYKTELLAVKSILSLLNELEKRGKIIRQSDSDVDADVLRVKAIEPAKDFDDPHIVALIRVSGCKLICIRDPRAHKFLRASYLYDSPRDRPKLYTREKNVGLLCLLNIPLRFR